MKSNAAIKRGTPIKSMILGHVTLYGNISTKRFQEVNGINTVDACTRAATMLVKNGHCEWSGWEKHENGKEYRIIRLRKRK